MGSINHHRIKLISLFTPLILIIICFGQIASAAADAPSVSASAVSSITQNESTINGVVTGSYKVTYSINGSTGGSVPVDSKTYANGEFVTVLGNTGNLVKKGVNFLCWNTKSDGSGTDYADNTTFCMGNANITLYAKWTANSGCKVIYSSNGSTGGSVPSDSKTYGNGGNVGVTVLGNTGNLVKSGYALACWNTKADGSGTNYMPKSTFNIGSTNVTLYAKWTTAPSIITNSWQRSFTPKYIMADSSQVNQGKEFLFYSNNPEVLNITALADSGCWLNKAAVRGSGQVYIWHRNCSGIAVNSCLLIYNPNDFAIKVTSKNYGTTNARNSSDSSAWLSYFKTQTPVTKTINAHSQGSMFFQSIPNGNSFGVVANVNITDCSGNSSSAVLYDLAYYSRYSETNTFAAAIGKENRGLGASYKTTYNFPAISPMDSAGIAYQISSFDDSFNGGDLTAIVDNSGILSGKLTGSYGQLLTINLPIRNSGSVDRNFYIYIGSNGGTSFPLIKLNETYVRYNWIKATNFVDVINTGVIPAGTTRIVNFTLVIPAMSSTPYVIGAHT